jgi:hypothetical protein
MSFWMQFVRPATNLPEWYEPPTTDFPDLYDLTIQGMGAIVTAMSFLYLLDEEAPVPEVPRWEDVGLSTERGQELFQYWVYRPQPGRPTLEDVIEPHERAAFADYLARFEAATGQPAPPDRALGYKFRSCDGWLVTPDECLVIADVLEENLANFRGTLALEMGYRGYPHTEESIADLLSPWAKYNRVAADHGGYRVW